MDERRGFWVGTGWKMNKTLGESLAYAETLAASERLASTPIRTFVIPPFTSVREVKRRLADTPVLVGAQNMHWAVEGAWTGEVSAAMLVDCELDLVELGHSERRSHFGETDERVGLKVEAAVRAGLMPLVCIGESAEERDAGLADTTLERQVRQALRGLSGSWRDAPVLLAYEPVWAIGEGGTAATPEYTDARHAHVISVAEALTGRTLPCLYGGSVDAGNCVEYTRCRHVDGLFIGRSAWDVESYLDVLGRCDEALRGRER